MRLKADLTLLVVAVVWGTAFVAQRVAGQLGSVYLFNGARYLLAGMLVLPFIMRGGRTAQGKAVRIPPAQWRWMSLAGGVLFLAAAFQQAGLLYTTAGNAGFITSLYVVLVPVVLLLGWRERPGWLALLAVALAGLGAYLLSTGGTFEVQAGDALELIGAVFWTLHVVLLGKFAPRFDPLTFSAGQLLICGGLNLVLGALVEQPVFTPALIGAAVYTAIFSLGLGYTLQVWGQRHTPPADAALILSLESVFAAIFGWLLLDERLSAVQAFGCALIFGAVLMSQVRARDSGTMEKSAGSSNAG
jgi:drug/metabolite transporter (DMT)-like permease